MAGHPGPRRPRRLVPALRRRAGRAGGGGRRDGSGAAGRRQRAVVAGRRPRSAGGRWSNACAPSSPGKLVYSANWDHYRSAPLYDLVDEEGISAYFNLREASGPADDAALEAGWRRVRREIDAWRVGRTRPLIFTELGYRSRAGATAAPWDETTGGTPDVEEQRRAFAAFRRVWATAPNLTGVYVWNWYGYGGPGTTSYTPRGKPAENEVRALLGAM